MQRQHDLDRHRQEPELWDVLVVGGGATGLGAAVESASRGYTTLLLEADDLAKGTSSRSTKLVHGGVRYLRQGNVSLVLEALRERGLLLRNAPHLVGHLPFVVPTYDWWEGPFYGVGLRLYDALAGKLGISRSRSLDREEVLERIPTLEPEGLRGGTVYYDGQFDDARLAVTLARTAQDLGATVVTRMRVVELLKRNDLICGVMARDMEADEEHRFDARVVVNATGVFADGLRLLDDPSQPTLLRPSQGVHLVLDTSFLPSDHAIMVPHTSDGRVLFAVPWHDRIVVGTTDTPVDQVSPEPGPLDEEVDYLLTHAAQYLTKDPVAEDVLSVFAGLRPLVAPASQDGQTASISRDHHLEVSTSGLVTITGGKWTTYRKMGEDTVDAATAVAGLPERPSKTESLRLHGWLTNPEASPWDVYGSDAPAVRALCSSTPAFSEKIHPDLDHLVGEVIWAVREELALSVEDVLSRRTRALLLDARAAAEAAPAVAAAMATELARDEEWATAQVESFRELAAGYVLGPLDRSSV